MERAKEVSHFNNNSLHKQTSHRQHLLVPHKPLKNKKQPMPKKAGVMILTPIGQMTGQDMNPNYGYDGDYSQGDWYNWSYFASAEELTESEDKHSESLDVISEDGQRDQINQFCFSAFCLFRLFGHERVEAFAFVLLFVSVMYQCFADVNRSLFKSICQVENSVSTESGDLHSFRQHRRPLNSVSTEECVFLNYDHGAQQPLLCEYVDLGSHPTL